MGLFSRKASESTPDRSSERNALIAQVNAWHDAGEHQRIINAIEAYDGYESDYDISGLLARAYNNLAHPGNDTNYELIEKALGLLMRFEMDGLSDALWHYRVGFSLYWLDREAEALPHFEQAVALDPSDEESAALAQSCKKVIDSQTVVRPVTMERIQEWFDNHELKYAMEENGDLRTGFAGFLAVIGLTDEKWPQLKLLSVWTPDAPMDMRAELVEACNEWNLNTRRPKAYVETRDDGVLWVPADSFQYVGTGMTQEHLSATIDMFLHGSDDLSDFLAARFPQLVAAAGDAESEDGNGTQSCE